MKSLLTIALFATSTFLMSFDSNATERNPWSTFNEVVNTFNTANGQFQNLSADEQSQFLQATEHIKSRLSHHNGERAAEKLKQVNLTENIFRFVWTSKEISEDIDINMEIPKAPVVQ
ncbi:hypothetical protein SAMN06298216_2205 [Spirosomataceae bacterium TFI 002]|nr:hypothetical protein SAMN06298216_2205 [Spirosomataceae bacterium TFI 002]